MLHTRSFLATLLSMLLLASAHSFGTSGQQADSSQRPEINYPGTLIERSDHEQPIRVNNIALGKVYATTHISAYEKPSDPIIKPQQLVIELNFRDIHSISVPRPEPITIDQRTYTEFVVTYRPLKHSLNQKTQEKTLLIEESTFLFCDTDEPRPVAKRILLKAVKKLTIDEGQIPAPPRDIRIPLSERERKRSHACTEVADHLSTLQDEAAHMPPEQQQKVGGMIETIKNWLGELCGNW
jgi:hypothetical protein